jgi:hypothetical protein
MSAPVKANGSNPVMEEAVVEGTLALRQLYIATALILGGAMTATLGILLVKETDATKLTAIISLATAVIGAGAAILPTGAASKVLSRPQR